MQITLFSVSLLLFFFLLPVALFSFVRHRAKAAKKKLDLIGKVAIVQTELSPKGAILVNGELWLAKSCDKQSICAGSKVTVTNMEGHLLRVDSISFD